MTNDRHRDKRNREAAVIGELAETAELSTEVPKAKRRRKRKKVGKVQIDLAALLSEPHHVLRDGKPGKMDPVEGSIRRQVQKALAEKSIAAIKVVIDLAIEHELVAPLPTFQQGGVVVVPTSIGMDLWLRIFRDHEFSIDHILAIVRTHYEQSDE